MLITAETSMFYIKMNKKCSVLFCTKEPLEQSIRVTILLSAKHFYVSEFPRALTYVRTYVRTRLLAHSLLQIYKTLDSHKRLGFLSIFTYLSIFSLSQIYSVCIPGSYHCTDILNVQLVNFSWKSEKIKYLCEDGATFFDQYV